MKSSGCGSPPALSHTSHLGAGVASVMFAAVPAFLAQERGVEWDNECVRKGMGCACIQTWRGGGGAVCGAGSSELGVEGKPRVPGA